MSKFADERGPPPAVRHQQIMEIAEEQPEATMEEIAKKIPSVTVDLVEQVLEGCGDPAEKKFGTTSNNEDLTMSKESDSKKVEGLTDKQYRTLEAIYDNPNATQEELADLLTVSAPTISKRVNAIPGLEWGSRRQFVEDIFDDTTYPDQNSETDGSQDHTDAAGVEDDAKTEPPSIDEGHDIALRDLEQRVDDLESKVGAAQQNSRPGLTIEDPKLIKKLVQVSLDSDEMSEEEEIALLESVMSCE